MKRLLGTVLFAVVLVVATGCDISEPVGTSNTTLSSAHVSVEYDGDIATVDLIAGQHTKVGEVSVEWLGDNQAEVTYQITEFGWCITEWHLHIGEDEDDIPRNRPGNPQVGLFQYSGEPDCVTSVSQIVDTPGESFVVAAQAVVKTFGDADADYVYGMTKDSRIHLINLTDMSSVEIFNTGLFPGDDDWPNGLAFDKENGLLYYANEIEDLNRLRFVDVNNPTSQTLAGELKYRSAGATFYDGAYYYIPHNLRNPEAGDFGDDLRKVTFDGDGNIAGESVVFENFTGESGVRYQFGDLAVKDGVFYFHGQRFTNGPDSGQPIEFSVLDPVSDDPSTGDYNVIKTDYDRKLQLAFNSDDSILYGHDAGEDAGFYEIDLVTGDLTALGPIDPLRRFNDLSEALPPQVEEREETAWGAGDRFVDRGNWAMYFWVDFSDD